MSNNKYSSFIGIDVSKDKIDLYILPDNKHISCANNKTQIKKAVKSLKADNPLIIVENTGGYEKICIDTLIMLKIPVHRTDNRKVKSFIRSYGILSKTDKEDAKALALYGKQRYEDLSLYNKPSQEQEKLRELALYLVHLKKLRAAEKTRFQSPGCDIIKQNISATIKAYDKIISGLDKKMLSLINSIPKLQRKLFLLEQFKGVGKISALQILAHMPELGSLSRREVAALAGVAPYAKDSGKMQGIRRIYGGREIVRNSLFMVAMSAAKFNPKIKAYYEKLKKNGKKPMVALTACMRKIITILNAIIRDDNIILTS